MTQDELNTRILAYIAKQQAELQVHRTLLLGLLQNLKTLIDEGAFDAQAWKKEYQKMIYESYVVLFENDPLFSDLLDRYSDELFEDLF